MEEREGELEGWYSADWERAGFSVPGGGGRPRGREGESRARGRPSLGSAPTSTSEERDLARWMLSTVGGAMCFPPVDLCFVKIFLWPCGDLSGVMS
jgi:hypothetical protein